MKVKCVANTSPNGTFLFVDLGEEKYPLTVGKEYEIGLSDQVSGGSHNFAASSRAKAIVWDDEKKWNRVPLELFAPVSDW